VEEIVAVVRVVGDRSDGQRVRALIVLLWRAGLRISEALAIRESDLDSKLGGTVILVTGGLGFIVSHTARALTELGETCVVTRHSNSEIPAVPRRHGRHPCGR